jgi:hypothetical protein
LDNLQEPLVWSCRRGKPWTCFLHPIGRWSVRKGGHGRPFQSLTSCCSNRARALSEPLSAIYCLESRPRVPVATPWPHSVHGCPVLPENNIAQLDACAVVHMRWEPTHRARIHGETCEPGNQKINKKQYATQSWGHHPKYQRMRALHTYQYQYIIYK